MTTLKLRIHLAQTGTAEFAHHSTANDECNVLSVCNCLQAAGRRALRLPVPGVTTGPTILPQWLPNGTSIAGTQFTLRGYLDDPAAEIRA